MYDLAENIADRSFGVRSCVLRRQVPSNAALACHRRSTQSSAPDCSESELKIVTARSVVSQVPVTLDR